MTPHRPLVAIATQIPLSEPDLDEPVLMGALAASRVDAALVPWHSTGFDWATADLVVIRSTWGYHQQIDCFLQWVEHVERTSRLLNPPAVVRRNAHKSYLLDLEANGVPVVPTELVSRGAGTPLSAIAEARGWRRLVVKPAVSAGSWHTHVIDDPSVTSGAYAELVAARDVLVQPYIDTIHTVGERSLVWIDGEFMHCMHKQPRFAGADERTTGPHPIEPEDLSVARAALALAGDGLLYGRVDLMRDGDGTPMVSELELIEPSLFVGRNPAALARLVAAIEREAGCDRLRSTGAGDR